MLSEKTGKSDETVIVNVGAGYGHIGIALRVGNMEAKIFSIDTRTNQISGGLDRERRRFQEEKLLEKAPFPLLGTVKYWAKNWLPEDRIDLIYFCIRPQPLTQEDIEVWYPHMKDDGMFAFAGYDSTISNVKSIVDSCFDPETAVFHHKNVVAFKTAREDDADVHSDGRE